MLLSASTASSGRCRARPGRSCRSVYASISNTAPSSASGRSSSGCTYSVWVTEQRRPGLAAASSAKRLRPLRPRWPVASTTLRLSPWSSRSSPGQYGGRSRSQRTSPAGETVGPHSHAAPSSIAWRTSSGVAHGLSEAEPNARTELGGSAAQSRAVRCSWDFQTNPRTPASSAAFCTAAPSPQRGALEGAGWRWRSYESTVTGSVHDEAAVDVHDLPVEERGVDDPGRDRVAAYSLRGEFGGDRLRQTEHSGLRRRVGGADQETAGLRGLRGEVDDSAVRRRRGCEVRKRGATD